MIGKPQLRSWLVRLILQKMHDDDRATMWKLHIYLPVISALGSPYINRDIPDAAVLMYFTITLL